MHVSAGGFKKSQRLISPVLHKSSGQIRFAASTAPYIKLYKLLDSKFFATLGIGMQLEDANMLRASITKTALPTPNDSP